MANLAKIRLLTSGKGGAGKSTAAAYTGAALARRGGRVLLLEMDCGLRTLDIMLGVSDQAVFDLSDVLTERVESGRAVVECAAQPGLYLLPAPIQREFIPEPGPTRQLCESLSRFYSYILIDTPAGFGAGLDAAVSAADAAFIVATPDPVSVRDAASVSRLMFGQGLRDVKLIINRLPPRPRQMLVPDLDYVIDSVGAQLIGVVPEDPALMRASAMGVMPPPDSPAAVEFDCIASRMDGVYIPLAIR